MLDSKMDPPIARGMLRGAPDTLHSEFRLGNCMLLQLLRGGAIMAPRELLAASYKQFQVELALPKLQQRITELQVRSDSVHVTCTTGHTLRNVCAFFAPWKGFSIFMLATMQELREQLQDKVSLFVLRVLNGYVFAGKA